MSQPKFRKNQTTGRLEKLINGKYTPQKSAGFWDWDSKEGRKRNRNNPLRIIRDTIRNVNYEKKRRKKLEDKNSSKTKTTTKNKSKLNVNFGTGVKIASGSTKSKTKTKVTNEKDTGPTKLIKNKDCKVTRVRVSDTKTKDDGGKAAWLKKSRNSPAAKSGAFTDDERWAMHTKHKSWKAHRKAGTIGDWEKKYEPNRKSRYKNTRKSGTHGKSLPSNPQLKTQTTKDKRDPNRHAIKITPKDLPKDKVKMKDGSIVDRSSLYEKKKKKKVSLGTNLSKMFDN